MRIEQLIGIITTSACLISGTLISGAQTNNTSSTTFDRLAAGGLHLVRSTSADDPDLAVLNPNKIKDPATLSFLTSDKHTVYSADFALIWQPQTITLTRAHKQLTSRDIRYGLSIEGKVASNDSQAEDAWRAKTSLYFFGTEHGAVTSTFTTLSAEYESDRDFRTQKAIAELRFTPTIPAISAGELPPGLTMHQLPFIWRPYFGIDAGGTLTKGTSNETSSTVLRLIFRAKGHLYLRAPVTGTRSEIDSIPYLFFDNKFFDLPIQKGSNVHNLIVAGVEFPLSPNVSLGFTYKEGEDSPDFNHIQTFGGQIGVRF